MNIFTLTGTILVDSSKAENSISKTTKEAEGLGNKLASGLKTAKKWGGAVVGAATAVGGAMVALAKDTASTLDVIDKGSIRMGISAESYQELAHAADLSGVSMSTLEKAAKSLMGTGMNLDDAIDQIMSYGTEAQRTAAATQLFGEKVAYEMQPLLASGAEGLEAMKQEAHDLGLVFSQDTVSAGAKLNDMFSNVQSSLKALKNGLMADLMPYIMEILQWVLDNMPVIQETVRAVMNAVLPIVKAVLDVLMTIIPPVFEMIKSFLDWVTPYLEPIIDSITGIIEAFISLISGDFSGFLEGLAKALAGLGETFLKLGEEIMNDLLEGLKNAWEGISQWLNEKLSSVKESITSIFTSTKEASSGLNVNGKHAAGLSYVPYDGYVAELHRGESVLNAQTAQELLEQISTARQQESVPSRPIEVVLNVDKHELARATFDAYEYEADRNGPALGRMRGTTA